MDTLLAFAPPFSPGLYALIAALYLCAFVVYGMMGFGAAALTTPILAHFLPLRFLVPLSTLQDFVLALILGRRAARKIVMREYVAIVVPMLAGMAIGLTLLINLPQRLAMAVLGVVVAANSIYALVGRAGGGTIARGWAIPFGLAGGIAGGLFGFGGPLYVIYLSRRIADTSALRSTIGAIIFTSSGVRLVMLTTSGLLAQENLWLAIAWLFPFALAGALLGTHLHLRASPQRMRLVLNLLLLATGATLVLRAL